VTFPRRLLTDGEAIVVELRPSWAFLGWPLVAFAAAAVLAGGLDIAFSPLPTAAGDALLIVLGIAALWLAGRAARWVTTTLALTTTRVVERSGVLGRRALEIRLDRINELSYHQSLLARLARTGEVMVEVGGETGVVMFEHVRRPAAFQSLITEQMSAFQLGRRAVRAPAAGPGPDATPPTGAPPVRAAAPTASVADRLVQLGELRRRGIVNEAEYEAKKAELLRQL